MASIEEKLKKLSSFVLEDATKQRDELVKALEKEKEEKIDEKELEILSEAYTQIQKTVSKYRRENNERILKIEMELKKKLIVKRENIIENVFEAVQNRIVEYIQTPEYKVWLADKIKKAIAEVGEGEKIVYVTKEDMKYKDFLEKEFEQVTVEESNEDDLIGGVEIFNRDKQVFVNYSIRDMLEEQKNLFLQTSGLNIN